MCPIWPPVFFLFFYNEPELGVGIDPGMALIPLSSSIGWGSNPRPSDHEPSAQPLDHSFSYPYLEFAVFDYLQQARKKNFGWNEKK